MLCLHTQPPQILNKLPVNFRLTNINITVVNRFTKKNFCSSLNSTPKSCIVMVITRILNAYIIINFAIIPFCFSTTTAEQPQEHFNLTEVSFLSIDYLKDSQSKYSSKSQTYQSASQNTCSRRFPVIP